MQRVCFQLRIIPDLIDEYVRAHEQVWPSMLAAIADSGRRNYSLFLAADGLLIGYYEVDDDALSAALLVADPRTQEWEYQAQRFFVTLEGERADTAAPHLREVFNLESQLLAGAGAAGEDSQS